MTQILAYQFTEMADLLPDNLGNPTSGTLFPYRKLLDCAHDKHAVAKTSDFHDILTWVECFNSYIAVITSFRPERARDLLAYMTLIIHIAKQFPGRCWYNYDRGFRLQATASNLINWTQINSDLYHCHTSVAVQTSRPQTSRMRERRGNQSSPITCKSWNAGACSSPHEFCRFRHKCDRAGCDGPHRRIECQELVRKRGRSPGDEQSRRRHANHD